MSNVPEVAPTSTTDAAQTVEVPDAPAQSVDSTPATPGAEAPHWASTFGEGVADKLKDYKDLDDLVGAAERGKGYKPATTLEEFNLGEKPTHEAEAKRQESYKRFCMETGVTPKMAAELAEWNEKTFHELRQASFEAGQAELRGKWGSTYDDKVNGALGAVVALDKRMGGKLSKELSYSGGNNNPVIIETLYTLSTLMSEATLSGANGGAGEAEPMSTLDFLNKEVFKNKE